MAKSRKKIPKVKRKLKSEATSWRAFEQLVTRIEHVLSPKGAVVKSPDFLLDKITNEYREVDASIKYKIGTSEIIITIECRERSKVQDTTWIEQLATKQQNIGSNKTIAVSSNGFSEPAIKKAKQYGIEVRKVDKIDVETINKWIVVRTQINYHVVDWKIMVDIPYSLRKKFSQELKDLKPNLSQAKTLILNDNKNILSLNDIFHDLLKKGKSQIDKVVVPQIGHSVIIKLQSKFPKGHIYFKTSIGNFDLVGLNFDFTLYKDSSTIIEQTSAFTYSNTLETLIEGKEFEVTSSNGTKELITIHTDVKDGKSMLSVWKEEKK